MIQPKSSDLLHVAGCRRHGLRLLHVDVADSARALEHAHLCGPTAGLVLAEALAGVALLGGELEQADETITLRLRVTGPVQGVLVEASRDGGLRGYPHAKVLNDLDDREEIDSAPALGDRGEAQVVRSLPGRLLAQGAFDVRPANVATAVELYFSRSQQRPALAVITALSYSGYIDLARGFLVECLPDGNRREFARLRQRADDGSLLEALESAHGFAGVAEELGLQDLTLEPPRPLRFACRCSSARAESTLAALPVAELTEMVAGRRPTDIVCHMCGHTYTIPAARLAALLRSRRKGPQP